ncbi:MAG: hypothetical protein ABI199_00440 [Bacteroidia bacterium]
MQKNKLFLIAIFMFLNLFFLEAQTNVPAKKDSAHTAVTVKVMVFNPAMTKNYFSNRYIDSTKNAIKINPLLIARGDVPIYYERKIAGRFSAEIAAGITFTDFVYEFETGDVYSTNGTTVMGKTGYSLEGALRYYIGYKNTAMSGYYISPDVWYRTYNKQVEVEDVSGNLTGNFDPDSRKVLSYRLLFGNQNSGDNALFFDWYIGVGMAQTTLNKVTYGVISTSYGIGNQTTIVSSQKWDPVFSLGVRIGLGF